MKVVHFAHFAPHMAGIYETAKDLVLAERKVGIDAQMVDYGNGLGDNMQPVQRFSRVGMVDGDITTIAPDQALKADIVVRHSALPKEVIESHIPVVMPLHGAPEYSFLLEHTGRSRTMKEIMVSVQNPDYKGLVTFWEQNQFTWEILLGRKVSYCPATVDLNFFNPKGKKFDFGKKVGKINIVITNIWRKEYHTPFNVLFAAAKFIKEKCPEGRIFIFGTPGDNDKYPKNDGPVNRMLLKLQAENVVADCYSTVKNLDEVYRAADILVTPSTIAQRTVREALACGCPIVAAAGNSYTPYHADPRDVSGFADVIDKCYLCIQNSDGAERRGARMIAEEEFNFDQAGKAMKNIFSNILL